MTGDQQYTFAGCGCCWPVAGPPSYPGGLPRMRVDFDNVPFCSRTAALMASGRTKGVFQLGKRLGQKWAKGVKPRDRHQVSALTAVLRPGTLKAKDEDGVSMTERYARRNTGQEPATPLHPSLASILDSTNHILCYQESLMRIVAELAGFDGLETEAIRKGVGKKDVQLLASLKTKFIERAEAFGVIDRPTAEKLWEQIEKSGRYLFSLNHAWAYGGYSIITAWIKAHDPPTFFASWLRHAGDSSDPDLEKAELVADARLFGVDVRCPDLRLRSVHTTVAFGNVTFGLADVSGVGETAANKLLGAVAGADLSTWTWYDYLYRASGAVASNVNERLMESGALDFLKADRLRMLEEYRTWRALSPGERAWVQADGRPLPTALKDGLRPKKDGGFLAQAARKEIVEGLLYCLERPQASLYDTPSSLETMEVKTLGVSLTSAPIDAVDTSAATHALATLADPGARRRQWDEFRVAAAVVEAKHKLTKKGDPMIWLTVTDGKTTMGDIAVFGEQVAEYGFLLRRRNVLMLDLVVGGRGGFLLQSAQQL